MLHIRNTVKTNDWFYKDTVTLDPSRVEDAWGRLDSDQAIISLTFLPEIIGDAFLATLKERGYLR